MDGHATLAMTKSTPSSRMPKGGAIFIAAGRRSYTSATSSRMPGDPARPPSSSRGRRPWRSRGRRHGWPRYARNDEIHPSSSRMPKGGATFIAAGRRSYTSATSSRMPGDPAAPPSSRGRRPWRSRGRCHGWPRYARNDEIPPSSRMPKGGATFIAAGRRSYTSATSSRMPGDPARPPSSSRMPGHPARPPSGPLRVPALFPTALSGRRPWRSRGRCHGWPRYARNDEIHPRHRGCRRVARPSSRRGAAPTHQRRHRGCRAILPAPFVIADVGRPCPPPSSRGRRPWRSRGRCHGWPRYARNDEIPPRHRGCRRVARSSSRRGAAPTHQRRHRGCRAILPGPLRHRGCRAILPGPLRVRFAFQRCSRQRFQAEGRGDPEGGALDGHPPRPSVSCPKARPLKTLQAPCCNAKALAEGQKPFMVSAAMTTMHSRFLHEL